MSDYPPTPELDRQLAVMDQARAIQGFYDWLTDQGLRLAVYETRVMTEVCNGPSPLRTGSPECRAGKIWEQKYVKSADSPDGDSGLLYVPTGRDCARCEGTGWEKIEREGYYEDGRSPEQLFADYFEIDRDKIEAERRAILEHLRETT